MKRCCICGEKIEGMGNNAWPIVNDERKRCCDTCNYTYVLAARIAGLRKSDVAGAMSLS